MVGKLGAVGNIFFTPTMMHGIWVEIGYKLQMLLCISHQIHASTNSNYATRGDAECMLQEGMQNGYLKLVWQIMFFCQHVHNLIDHTPNSDELDSILIFSLPNKHKINLNNKL